MLEPTLAPTRTMADGHAIPQLGLGTWPMDDDEAFASVGDAFRAGYRLVDTAAAYGNEAGVGRAVAASGLPREELFVTTKLAGAQHGRSEALAGLDESLARLRPRLRRPVPHPLAAAGDRQVRRDVGGAGRPARAGEGEVDRGLELHPRPGRRDRRAHGRLARREPGRAAPGVQPVGAPRMARPARHRDRVVQPARPRHGGARQSGCRRSRRGARPHPCAGDPPVAQPDRCHSHPQVCETRRGCDRTSTSSASSSTPTRWPSCTASIGTTARAAIPRPTSSSESREDSLPTFPGIHPGTGHRRRVATR